MYERLPEPVGLAGVDVPEQRLSESAVYYARERHFQDLLFKQCSDGIWQAVDDTLGPDKTRQREREIVQVYLQYLSDILFHDQPVTGIAVDVEKFKHHYDKIYGRDAADHYCKADCRSAADGTAGL